MPTDSDYIRYSAEALRVFSEAYLAPNLRVPFPEDAPSPPPPPPATPLPVGDFRFQSGIKVWGDVYQTSQQRRLRVPAGGTFSFSGGNAKLGMVADGRDPWNTPPMPYHGSDAGLPPGTVGSAQVPIIIAVPRTPDQADPFQYLQEAVLVEVGDAREVDGPLPWPRVVRGATLADVGEFLAETSWCPETREGWAGRYGHPYLNWDPEDEPAYGGILAQHTSFGALLLASDLPFEQKMDVQERMLLMASDMMAYGIGYPADGGHGIGRLFPMQVHWAIGYDSLPSSSFSETQQLIPYTGPGNLAGIGWRHHETDSVDMTSSYVVCCTANRWAGAALVAGITPFLNSNIALDNWVAYTRAYLASRVNAGPPWQFVKHARSRELILANRAVLGY